MIVIDLNKMVLDLLTFGTLLSGILVITSKNPVIAVVFLISTFINAAGYLIISGISFVGLTYIIVYVGAITVLFLFVIMMINIKLVDILETGSQYTKNIPLGIVISLLFLYEFVSLIPASTDLLTFSLNILNKVNSYFLLSNTALITTHSYYAQETLVNPFIQLQSIGQGLYTYGAIWLIISSIILLLSMIAPIFMHAKQTN